MSKGRLVIPAGQKIEDGSDQRFGHIYTIDKGFWLWELIKQTPVYIYAKPPTLAMNDKALTDNTHQLLKEHGVVAIEDGENRNSIHGQLAQGQKVLAREVQGNPDILEVVVFENIGGKDNKPETGKAIKITNKGYVLKRYLQADNVQTFVPSHNKLFPNNNLFEHVTQNNFGDCFLLASILAILSHPNGKEYIRQMMKQEGNTTVVRLFDPRTQQSVYIRVDNTQLHENGRNMVKHEGDWVHYLEKAFVIMAQKEIVGPNNERVFVSGDASFLDIYGAGGFHRTALSVLTGQVVLTTRNMTPSKAPFPLDKQSLNFCRSMAESTKSLLDAYDYKNNPIEFFTLENAVNALVREDGDIVQLIKGCLVASNVAEIFAQLDALVREKSNTHLNTIVSLVKIKLQRSGNDAEEKNMAFINGLAYYLSFASMPLEAANYNIQKNFLPLSMIAMLGDYLRSLEQQNKPAYTVLMVRLEEVEKLTSYEEAKSRLKMIEENRLGMPLAVRTAVLQCLQRFYFEPPASAAPSLMTSVDFPLSLPNLGYCHRIYDRFKRLTLLNTHDLVELEKMMERMNDLAVVKSVVESLSQAGNNFEALIQASRLSNEAKINLTYIAKKIVTSMAQDAKGTQDQVSYLKAYIDLASELKGQVQPPAISKMTRSVADIRDLGAYLSQLDKDGLDDKFKAVLQESKLMEKINVAVASKNYPDHAAAMAELHALLYQLKTGKAKNGKTFPAVLLEKFEQYITSNFLISKTERDLDKGRGVYSNQSLAVFNELQQHLSHRESGYVAVASTKSVADGFPVDKAGLYAGHAYAVLKVRQQSEAEVLPGQARLMYVTLRNPWGRSGREDNWQKLDSVEHGHQIGATTENGTFELELSEFAQAFSHYTMTTVPKPRPVQSLDDIAAHQAKAKSKAQFFARHHKLILSNAMACGVAFGTLGVIAGILAAPLTFGLSMPVFAGISFGIGLAVGAVVGVVEGLVIDKMDRRANGYRRARQLDEVHCEPVDAKGKHRKRPDVGARAGTQKKREEGLNWKRKNETTVSSTWCCILPQPRKRVRHTAVPTNKGPKI